MHKENYMTKQDVYLELLFKIKINDQYELLTEDEKSVLIKEKVNYIIEEMYDVDRSRISYLSERDTFIIRKLYGVLDNGLCSVGVELVDKCNVSNVGCIKSRFFLRITRDLIRSLRLLDFEKKRKMFFELLGVDYKFLCLNIVLFNSCYSEEILDVDNYIASVPFSVIVEDIKQLKILIKNNDDIKKFNLDDRQREILALRFGLNNDAKCYTVRQVAEILNISRSRVHQLEEKIFRIIRNQFDDTNNKQVVLKDVTKIQLIGETPIRELGLSLDNFNALLNRGIKSIEELLSLTKEDLLKIKSIGSDGVAEIFERINLIKVANGMEIGSFETAHESNAIEVKLTGYTPISCLQMSNRITNVLMRAGIITIEELSTKTEEDLLKINNLGPLGIKQIMECIKELKGAKNRYLIDGESELSQYNKELELNKELLEEERRLNLEIEQVKEKIDRMQDGDVHEKRSKL